MDITSLPKPCISYSSRWRRLDIRNVVRFDIYDIRNELTKEFFIVFPVSWLSPAPRLNSLQNFIISRPKNNSRIVSQSPHLIYYFFSDIFQKLISAWIYRVTEHEIVENHNTLSRSHLIKLIRLILSSSPNPDHIEVRLHCIIQKIFVSVARFEIFVDQSRIHHIRRNVVCSLAIYGITIDYYFEVCSLAIEFYCSDAVNNLLYV